jgi:hypothetical protein
MEKQKWEELEREKKKRENTKKEKENIDISRIRKIIIYYDL